MRDPGCRERRARAWWVEGDRGRKKDMPPSKCPERCVAFRTGQLISSPSRPLALHLASPVAHSTARPPACVGGALAGTPLPEPLSRWLRGTAGAGRVLPPGAFEPCGSGEDSTGATVQQPPLGSWGLAWAKVEPILLAERDAPVSQCLGRLPGMGMGGGVEQQGFQSGVQLGHLHSFPLQKGAGFCVSATTTQSAGLQIMNY